MRIINKKIEELDLPFVMDKVTQGRGNCCFYAMDPFFLACQNHAFLTHLIDVLISNTNIFFILKDLQVIENRRIEIS